MQARHSALNVCTSQVQLLVAAQYLTEIFALAEAASEAAPPHWFGGFCEVYREVLAHGALGFPSWR
jgi:hypothetical protein